MIELFVLETCPYCRKVIEFMDENEIDYLERDVAEPENLLELQQLGGKSQVPFLFDEENDVRMYESDKIIEYLEENL